MATINRNRQLIVSAASQVVMDALVPDTGPVLRQQAGDLRDRVHRLGLTDTDKINSVIHVREVRDDGTVELELSGGCLAWDGTTVLKLDQPFDVGLTGYQGSLDVKEVLHAIPGVTIHPGGNIQNMTLDILAIASALAQKYPEDYGPDAFYLMTASSSDPFADVEAATAERLKTLCRWFQLPLEDRFAIQFRFELGDDTGHVSLTSPPAEVNEALGRLIQQEPEFAEAFAQSATVMSADAIGEFIDLVDGRPMYHINPSSARRADVAGATAKRPAILPMNCKEAQEVLRIILAKARNEEMHQVKKPPFPVPIMPSGEGIDWEALREVDDSLALFMRYNPAHPKVVGNSFSCIITFGEAGGLCLGTGSGHNNKFFVFTSVPSAEGAETIISYADSAKIISGTHDVGCGDSVAGWHTLANTVDPSPILEGFMRGQESEHKVLPDLATALFVSAMGRVFGSLVLRTTNTWIDNTKPDGLVALVEAVAESSVEAARGLVNKVDEPQFTELEPFGIHAVIWRPGQVPTVQ